MSEWVYVAPETAGGSLSLVWDDEILTVLNRSERAAASRELIPISLRHV